MAVQRSFGPDSEAALKVQAGVVARCWRDAGVDSLLVALRGGLGAGKTTWVRGLLEGFGYAGTVPSPTYTLVEHYDLNDVTIVHADLYRLAPSSERAEARELESLGLRDWLAESRTWVLVEWPERAPALVSSSDVMIDFAMVGAERRAVRLQAQSPAGELALSKLA